MNQNPIYSIDNSSTNTIYTDYSRNCIYNTHFPHHEYHFILFACGCFVNSIKLTFNSYMILNRVSILCDICCVRLHVLLSNLLG